MGVEKTILESFIMNDEQIIKKLEWLDDERRRDKNTISVLQDKIVLLEGSLNTLTQKNQESNREISSLKTLIHRMDSVDDDLAKHRLEIKRKIEALQKQSEKKYKETANMVKSEVQRTNHNLDDLRKELDEITDIKRELVVRKDGEERLSKNLAELKNDYDELKRNDEDLKRIYRLVEDGRRQDIKRITDLQGELIALRKQTDKQRSRLELLDINSKKIDTRLNELISAENERKVAQSAFIEKQAYAEVERENLWKSWQKRFEAIEKQAADIEEQIQAFDVTHRVIQQAQVSVEELSKRIERRLNEVMEIQRLGDDRFRQEWAAFKADDQKRWTNYTLSQDEQRGEINRVMDGILERVVVLEDQMQDAQDAITLMVEQTRQRMQNLLAMIREWSSYFDDAK